MNENNYEASRRARKFNLLQTEESTRSFTRGCWRKKTYSSKRLAKAKIKEVKTFYGQVVRPYKCKHCRKWHLTSQGC